MHSDLQVVILGTRFTKKLILETRKRKLYNHVSEAQEKQYVQDLFLNKNA